MTQRGNPSGTRGMEMRLDTATDEFITNLLPAWLQQVELSQVKRLSEHFKILKASHEQVRAATKALVPLQDYAQARLRSVLPASVSAEVLEWLEVVPRLDVPLSSGWPDYEPGERRFPGLLRLMQNFHEGARFFEGSGLVAVGEQVVLTPDVPDLVRQCRSLDAGAGYQVLLAHVFDQATCDVLAAEKRAGLQLATTLATLQHRLDSIVLEALEQVTGQRSAQDEQAIVAYPGVLTVLGQPIMDGLLTQLRNHQGEDLGMVLYLPGDPEHALRHFESYDAMNQAMAQALRLAACRQYFSQRVELSQRPRWLALLEHRLADADPDLQIEGESVEGNVFDSLVRLQIKRLKDDARLLLVPTADVDHQASKGRLQAWKEAGLGLASLSGLFIPEVGDLLLGQFTLQTLAQVFEGAEDWHRSHQHEALEHMLGVVAENLALAGVLAGGPGYVMRTLTRSRFVDGLEPVVVEGKGVRLWANDLSIYESSPDDPRPGPDGLCGSGHRRWLRRGQRFYEVFRSQEQAPWRLRHPWRPGAFGPIVDTNGERSWRLRQDNPLEWNDSARMLDTLWPLREPLSARSAGQILRIADMDQAQLRALLVENRRVPAHLRDTLLRFDARERIEAYFDGLRSGEADDPQIQAWCDALPDMQALEPVARRERLLADQARLRDGLLAHLSREALADDELRGLVQRDFPGLPDAHAQEVVRDVPSVQRSLALVESRVPFELAHKARVLLQQARLARALEGIYLGNACSNQSAELVLAVLGRLPTWPSSVNLELREGSDTGRRLAVIDPQGREETRTLLVRKEGRFRLYDHRGHEYDERVAEPGGIFQAITALLTPDKLARLGVTGTDAPEALRQLVQQHLPATRKALLNLLGWREHAPWFNPGRRLPDGRLGYPLSGRAVARQGAEVTLRVRIRNLYPQFDDARVEEFLAQMLRLSSSPFDVLLAQERSYAQLDEALNRWEAGEPSVSRRAVCQRFGRRLRQSWRLQGETVLEEGGQRQGMRLDLSGFSLRTLPVIPVQVDFGHVTELVMSSMTLEVVPTEFLRCFSAVRRLNLADNRLRRLPQGVAYLTDLHNLQLAHNAIRLGPDSIEILAALPRLEALDLSFNPLGPLEMRWNHLTRLDQLRLRRCHLAAWPSGLELCERLSYVDLRDNLISVVAPETLRMPLAHRAAFIIEGNPLPAGDVARLVALDVDHVPHEAPVVGQGDLIDMRGRWLETSSAGVRQVRQAQWDSLSASPDSSGLFRLLDELQRTSDFQGAREYLTEQVWILLAFLEDNEALRARLYGWANLPRSCSDSVALQFSDLLVHMQVVEAEARAATQDVGSDLLNLGRRLFRLDQVERFASRDIAQRVAAGRMVDAIEISLFYRVRLAQVLELPFQPRSMRFVNLANVSDEQLQEALRTVRGAETTQALVESLGSRAFWQAYLENCHPAAFATIIEDYAARGTRLDEQQVALSSEQYTDQWDRLQSERESAVQVLVEQLTREALEVQALDQG